MKKTQLNKKSRELLFNLVTKKITTDKKAEEAYKAVFDEQIKIIIEEIEKKYPQDHMRILQIYDCARVDRCLKISKLESSWDRAEVQIPQEMEFPLVKSRSGCSSHYISEKAYYAGVEIQRAKQTFDLAIIELREVFNKLIIGSKTFEDLCQLWPEASEVASQVVNSSALQATINPDLIKKVKANLKERGVG